MANGGQIRYSVGFDVNQSQLNQLKTSLQELQRMTAQDFMKFNKSGSLAQAQTELNKIKTSIKAVDVALDKAFNAELGTVNIVKFNEALRQSKTNIQQLQQAYAKLGPAGATAFRNLSTSLLTTNNQLKQTHSFLATMSNTMKNTLKWGAASSVMNSFSNSIRSAYGYVKHLDTSLNDIRIVTGKSADEMDRFAKTANDAAKKLGQSTTDYTEAALIYYQQGLNDSESQTRAETTLKAANVTGQSGQEVSEQLTAVWNGYKVSAAETELYVDKLAAVAASTAADLEELSTGMSKVASAASTAGVDIDQLNATLATVVSVTRQAPETVGTAFKTIYARLGDLAVDGVDEFGTTLGAVSSKLKTMGIEILDETGDMRNMGEVVEEVAAKWDTWTSAQKQAAAVAMAGKRQYNNLIALFENWDMYEDALLTSANAAGTLQNQQDIYMESTAAHLKTLKASTEDVWDSLIDTTGINLIIDGLTYATNGIGLFTDAIGGSSGAIALLGAVGLGAFKKDISSGIATSIINMENMQSQTAKLRAEMEMLKATGAKVNNIFGQNSQKQIEGLKAMQGLNQPYLSQEQTNESNNRIRDINNLYGQIDAEKAAQRKSQDYVSRIEQKNLKGYDLGGKGLIDERDIGIIKSSGNLGKDLEGIQEKFSKAFNPKMVQATTAEVKRFGTAMGKANDSVEQQAQAFRKSQSGLDYFLKDAKLLQRTGLATGKVQSDLNDAYQKAFSAMTKAASGGTNYKQVLSSMNELQVVMGKAIAQGNQTLNERIAKEKQSADVIAQTRAQIKAKIAEEIQMQRSASMQGVIQGYVGAAQAASMLTVGVSSLVSAFKVLGNESMSTGEKFLQFMTSITSAGASIAMGITMLMSNVTAIKHNNLAYKVLSAQQADAAKDAAKTSQAKSAEAAAHTANAKAIDKETAAMLKQQATQKLYGKNVDIQGTPFKKQTKLDASDFIDGDGKGKGLGFGVVLDAFDKKLSNIGKNSTGPLKNVGKGLTDIGTKASKALPFLEKLPASVVGLGTAFSALGTASLVIWGISQALDAHNIRAEKAAEKAQQFQNAYAYAKSDYDNFVAKSNAYTSAIESLDELIEGTDEYQEKVREANAAALELLGTVDGLRADYEGDVITFKSADGELEGDAVLKLLEKERYNRLQSSQHTANQAQLEADALKNRANEIDFYRELKWGAYGDEINGVSSSELSTVIQDLSRELSKGDIGLDKAIENLQFDDDLATALKDNSSKVLELTTATNNLMQSEKILNETIVRAYLDEEPEFEGASEQKQDFIVEELAANSDDYLKDSIYTKNRESKRGITSDKAMSDKDIAEAYAETMDGNWQLDKVKEAKGVIIYKDMSGEQSDREVNIDYARETLARQEYETEAYNPDSDFYKSAEKNYQQYEDIAQKIVGEENQALIEALAGDIAELLRMDPAEINSYLDAKDYTDAEIELIASGVKDVKSEDISIDKELWNRNGEYETLKEFWNTLRDMIKNSNSEEAKQSRRETALERSEATIDTAVETEGFDKDELEEHRDLLLENEEAVKGNIEAATELAIVQKKQQRGIDNLCENWEDYNKILKDSESSYADQSKATKGILNSLKDLYDLTDEELEMLPANFVKDNLDKIEAVKNGVDGAYEDLLAEIGKEIIIDMKLKPEVETELSNAVDGIMNAIDTKDLEFGATLDDTNFTSVLQSMLDNGLITVDQLNAVLEGLEFSPEVTYEEVNAQEFAKNSTAQEVEVFNPDTGQVEVMKLSTIREMDEDATIRVPVINGSATQYKGGGGKLKSNKGKSGGGGGGGGGGSKPKKKYASTDYKKDRYREVNNSLKELSTELDRLTERQEKLFGKDLLNNLNQQLDVMKKQVEVTREKLKLAQEELKEYQTKRITNYEPGVYNDLLDFGIKFNADNSIANFEEIEAQYISRIDSMIAYYNSQSATWQASEAGEKYLESIEREKENLNTLKDLVGDYDELLYDTIPGLMDEITKLAYDMITIQIEKFNIEVSLRMDMTEAIKDWREFEREVIKDLDTDQLVDWGKSLVQETQDVINTGVIETATSDLEKKLAFAQEVLSGDTSKISANNPYASFIDGVLQTDAEGNAIIDKTAMWEDIDKSREEIQENLEFLREQEDELEDAYYSSIDAIGEAVDKQAEAFERVNDTLNHTVNLLEMIKGEAIYADKAQVYDQMFTNNLQALEAARKAELYYREEYEKAIARGATKEEIEQWEDLWLDAQDNVREAAEQTVEILTERFSNAVLKAIDDMDKALTDGRGLDSVQLEWEMNIDDDDRYLDSVNKAFAIQDLNNKITQSINETDSLSAQKRLNDLRDKELTKLREKEKLTQYDVDRANQLYEIELKKIALDEAQKNKSQMRLRRDASGNYSYQFVADQDSITEAQNELMEAYNNLYNMDKEQRKEMEQNIMDLQNALKESMQEFSELSVEEQKARRGEYERIWAHYNEQINDIAKEAAVAQSNLIESTHDAVATTFKDMSEAERKIMAEEMVPHFSEAVDTMIAKINGNNGLGDALDTAIDDIFDASQALADGIGMIESTLDLDSGSLSDITSSYYADAAQSAKDYAAAQQENIDKAKEEKEIMLELWDTIKLVTQGYLDMASAAAQAVQAAVDLKNATYGQEADEIASERSTSPGISNMATENNVAEVGDTVTLNAGGYTDNSDGKGTAHTEAINTKVKIAKIEPDAANPYQIAKLDGGILGWVTLDQLIGYDTGGYTGDWNNAEGRLALLHQKELVLNATDTDNILNAVKELRNIYDSRMLGRQLANTRLEQATSAIMQTVSLMYANAIGSTNNNTNNNSPIEIYADFPAAQSAYEIETALTSLINNASQFTHSTKR